MSKRSKVYIAWNWMQERGKVHWKPAGQADTFQFDDEETYKEWKLDIDRLNAMLDLLTGPVYESKQFYMTMMVAHEFLDEWSWDLLPIRERKRINKALDECEEGGYDPAFDHDKYNYIAEGRDVKQPKRSREVTDGNPPGDMQVTKRAALDE